MSEGLANQFCEAMDNLTLPCGDFDEQQLANTLASIGERLKIRIGYFLSTDRIYPSTKFLYQVPNPQGRREEKPIFRSQ